MARLGRCRTVTLDWYCSVDVLGPARNAQALKGQVIAVYALTWRARGAFRSRFFVYVARLAVEHQTRRLRSTREQKDCKSPCRALIVDRGRERSWK